MLLRLPLSGPRVLRSKDRAFGRLGRGIRTRRRIQRLFRDLFGNLLASTQGRMFFVSISRSLYWSFIPARYNRRWRLHKHSRAQRPLSDIHSSKEDSQIASREVWAKPGQVLHAQSFDVHIRLLLPQSHDTPPSLSLPTEQIQGMHGRYSRT